MPGEEERQALLTFDRLSGGGEAVLDVNVAAFPKRVAAGVAAKHNDRPGGQGLNCVIDLRVRGNPPHGNAQNRCRCWEPCSRAERLDEADGLGQPDFEVTGVVQPVERGLNLGPQLPAVLGEQARTERRHDVVVQSIEAVRTAPSDAEAFLEAERLGGRQEGEQRPLVLGELTEQRAEYDGGERVEGVAAGEALFQFRDRHGPSADTDGYRLLGERGGVLVQRLQFGVRPHMVDGMPQQSQELLAPLLERYVLEPALHLRPLGPAARTHVVGVAVECLVKNGHEQERTSRACRRLGEFLEYEDVTLIGVGGPKLQELAEFIDDQQEADAFGIGSLQILDRLLEQGGHGPAGLFVLLR